MYKQLSIDMVVALKPKDSDLIVRMFEPEYYVPRDAVRRAIANEGQFNIIHSQGIIKLISLSAKAKNTVALNLVGDEKLKLKT